jgi:chorismate mutase/prephenate dehydratase
MNAIPNDDPVLRRFRAQISETDLAILDAFNERLKLVAQVKAHKESRGIDFLDPDRERAMLEEMNRANSGPLSAEGVEELLRMILELSKREVAAREASSLRRPRRRTRRG